MDSQHNYIIHRIDTAAYIQLQYIPSKICHYCHFIPLADQPPKIHKTDIGQPVLPEDAEAGTAETQMTESNEMLIN